VDIGPFVFEDSTMSKSRGAYPPEFRRFAGLVKETLPASTTGKPIEIWFQSLPRA
jgi:hypothetical protein